MYDCGRTEARAGGEAGGEGEEDSNTFLVAALELSWRGPGPTGGVDDEGGKSLCTLRCWRRLS